VGEERLELRLEAFVGVHLMPSGVGEVVEAVLIAEHNDVGSDRVSVDGVKPARLAAPQVGEGRRDLVVGAQRFRQPIEQDGTPDGLSTSSPTAPMHSARRQWRQQSGRSVFRSG
jgi:hypothetical protein